MVSCPSCSCLIRRNAVVLGFFMAGLLVSCASSASITWELNASRRRPAFSSHLKSTIEGTCETSRIQSTHRCLTFPNPFCEKRSLGVSEKFCVVFRRELDDLFQELDLLLF